jgi:hypothetical protein
MIAGIALTGCGVVEGINCALGTDLGKEYYLSEADINFTNNAGGSATMYVDIDASGSTEDIADGATSKIYTLSTGGHTITFRNSADDSVACPAASVKLKACSTTNLSCSG